MGGLIIAGGGLAGVLTAVAFRRLRPEVPLTLLEAGPSLGGEHTWSFFASDLDQAGTALVAPFVATGWDGYDVRFRRFSRTFSTPYRSVSSGRLDALARDALGDAVRLGAPVARLDATSVTLRSGERLEGDAVIDARGPAALAGATLAFQKFLGREVRLARPHGLTRPTIMDAAVDQHDGYRFVYLLPFSADTVLIEDTYYADTLEVDADRVAARIDAYAAARGWSIVADVRRETGVLPLLLEADVDALWRNAAADGAVPIGLRAGLFHPVTGYSLPLAVRTALALAAPGAVTSARLGRIVEDLVREHLARGAFDRLLNRLLFRAGPPENRHRVLERFHRLPQPLIERFYAGRLMRRDVARILVGRPPVPVLGALRVLAERTAG